LSLLEAIRATGCSNLVFSSTGAVYGEAGGGLIGESAVCNPVNPYGRSKLIVEKMVGDFQACSDLRAISLRYFNACGAKTSGLIGELRDPETHLIPRALMKLQGHVDQFAMFGEDYDTPDGTAVRDYIHVVDLAEAHLLALNALLNGTRSGTFNLGTGVGYSVKEIISAIETVTRRKLDAAKKARRLGDPATLVANPSAATRVLGFRPQHSSLDSIVSSAWQWHRTAHPDVRPWVTSSRPRLQAS
jgi:UDP-arabinose 4-epimerase